MAAGAARVRPLPIWTHSTPRAPQRKVRLRAGPLRMLSFEGFQMNCDGNHRDKARQRVELDRLRGGPSVHPRHSQIHHDQVGQVPLDNPDHLDPVRCTQHAVRVVTEHRAVRGTAVAIPFFLAMHIAVKGFTAWTDGDLVRLIAVSATWAAGTAGLFAVGAYRRYLPGSLAGLRSGAPGRRSDRADRQRTRDDPPRGSTAVQAEDHVFVVLRPEVRPLVDRVFSPNHRLQDEHLPAVEFPLRASTTVTDLEEFYGIGVTAPAECTLDQLLRDRFPAGQIVPGCRIDLGEIALTVQEVADEGSVEQVRLAILPPQEANEPENRGGGETTAGTARGNRP